MLIGEYKNNLGDKNRVAMPKKFRDELGNSLIVTQGYEGCLIVVSPKQWEDLTKETATGPFVSGSVRDTTRFLLGGAAEVQLDKQGRFVLPKNLVDYSEIKDQVTFLGLGRWIEIWDTEKWNERKNYLAKNSSDIAEKLSQVAL